MINKICENCGKEFAVRKYRRDTAKFCSVSCHNHRRLRHVTCAGCGKQFYSPPSRTRKKWCSYECKCSSVMSLRQRREQHKRIQQASGRRGYRHAKKRIIEARGATCEICRNSFLGFEYLLDIHHVDKNCDNHSDENLALICCVCHRKLHRGDALCPSRKVDQEQLFLPTLER